MKVFSHLKKNLKNDFSHLQPIRVALLGDTATQFLSIAVRGTGYDRGLNLEIWEADFNQIERQVFDQHSELYTFEPEIIVLFRSTHKLLGKYGKLEAGLHETLAESEMTLIESLHAAIITRCKAKVIYYNYPEINDAVYGNHANKTRSSFLFQQRKLSYSLMEYAAKSSGFFICDLAAIQNQAGKCAMFQASIYINTEMVLSVDILPEVAAKTLDIIGAIHGKFKKCLILDLDNTLWGGIVGDDGWENLEIGTLGIGKAFTEFQYWIKKLKNRGIILAVCSKNTEATAKEPFEKHPDMVLHLEDITVFVANWESKADNIRHIQSILNIGFDTMVFLDDNPFERNIVKESLPEVEVPELPVDPADYLEYLYPLNLFETASFSKLDADRTKQYQIAAAAGNVQQNFKSEDDFLKSLNMVSLVAPFNTFNTPRVAQLSQRSNQFNLRTIRYTEQDIERLIETGNDFTFAFNLADKFGDHGLICMIILQKETSDTLFIDTWLMSCRVLKRCMENFVLNTITTFARENGFKGLRGEYLPTAKNEMVKYHYENLGFENVKEYWLLNVLDYKNRSCFINKK